MMQKLYNILRNGALFTLVLTMLYFASISWDYSLSASTPFSSFLNNTLFSTSKDNTTPSLHQSVRIYPAKIALKKEEVTYASMFNNTTIPLLYDDLIDRLTLVDKQVNPIPVSTYDRVFTQDNFIYLQFLAPVAALSATNSYEYLSELLIAQDTLYFHTDAGYFSTKVIPLDLPLVSGMDTKAFFTKNHNNRYILVSNDNQFHNLATITPLVRENFPTEKLISNFQYNPFVVKSFVDNQNALVYIDEHSRLSISDDTIEFESNALQGNLFQSTETLSTTDMIDLSMDLFNKVYTNIHSMLRARPYDIYTLDNQTVVVLTGELNGVWYDFPQYGGIFLFTNNSLSYAKINLVKAEVATSVKIPQKSSLYKENFVIVYNEKGEPTYQQILEGIDDGL